MRLLPNTARANVLAADEAKPIEPLLVAEAKALIILIHFTPTASAALGLPHSLQPPRQGGEAVTPGSQGGGQGGRVYADRRGEPWLSARFEWR